jgi:hypothetical protein
MATFSIHLPPQEGVSFVKKGVGMHRGFRQKGIAAVANDVSGSLAIKLSLVRSSIICGIGKLGGFVSSTSKVDVWVLLGFVA